jgi:hypothetical protein
MFRAERPQALTGHVLTSSADPESPFTVSALAVLLVRTHVRVGGRTKHEC